MNWGSLFGILAVVAGGVFNGSFAVPSRRIAEWKWEQVWLVYVTLGYFVLPTGLMLAIAPEVCGVLRGHLRLACEVVLLGCLWGFGALCYGYSLHRLGISITNAVVNGVSVLCGSLVPALGGKAGLNSRHWLLLSLGLFLTLLAIVAFAQSSQRRDRERAASGLGVFFALASGVLGAFLNLGFVFAAPLVEQVNGGPLVASLAGWVPVLFGAFVVNLASTARRLHRLGAWREYGQRHPAAWGLSVAMAVTWFCGVAVYGIGVLLMGRAGAVYGWAICVGVSILASTLWGIAIGEWVETSKSTRRWLHAGVALQMASLVLLAFVGASS